MRKRLLAGVCVWFVAAGTTLGQGMVVPLRPQMPSSPYGQAMTHPSYGYGSYHDPRNAPMGQPLGQPPVIYQPVIQQPVIYQPMPGQAMQQPMLQPMPLQPVSSNQENDRGQPVESLPRTQSDVGSVQPLPPAVTDQPGHSGQMYPPAAMAPMPNGPNVIQGNGGCPSGGCGTTGAYPVGTCSTGTCSGHQPCLTDCGTKCPCNVDGRVWLSAEWLFWTTNGYQVPALVTSSPPGTDRSLTGRLTSPGTSILFGDQTLHGGQFRSGLRIQGGFWLDECQTIGLDASYFFIGDDRTGFTAGGLGAFNQPQINRPFFNAATGLADAELVSFPNILSGSVSIDSRTSFTGADVNLRRLLCCSAPSACDKNAYRIDYLMGYRYLNLEEQLTITENLTTLPGAADALGVPPGTNINVRDMFRTLNEFHGGQIGLNGRYYAGNAFIDVTGKIAFGVTSKQIDIDGVTSVAAPGALLRNEIESIPPPP